MGTTKAGHGIWEKIDRNNSAKTPPVDRDVLILANGDAPVLVDQDKNTITDRDALIDREISKPADKKVLALIN